MFEKIKTKLTRNPSLEKRIEEIETLLAKQDDHWSYEEIRDIIDRTDLVPNMNNQELMNIAPSYERIQSILDEVAETDAHIGPKTLKYRLDMIEGSLDIFAMSHMNHTNYAEAEFRNMHGYNPSQTDETLRAKVDSMQKALDKIKKLLENAEFTITGKEALKL